MSNIIEMNNQNMFNTKLLEKMAKYSMGCNSIVQLFQLSDNPDEELTQLLSDKELLRSDKGRLLFELWNYENDSAATVAESAIELVQDAIESDLNNVAQKITDVADGIIQVFADLTNIKRSLSSMQKRRIKVPRVSAGPTPGDESDEHENTLSFAESIQSIVVGDLVDAGRREDYCCLPINHSYHFPTADESFDETADSGSSDVVMGMFNTIKIPLVKKSFERFFWSLN